jgi:hypothetical protein
MSTPRRPCPPAPRPLEDYCAAFDSLFVSYGRRNSSRRHLEGLLLPRDRNEITALAGAEPILGAQMPPCSACSSSSPGPPVVPSPSISGDWTSCSQTLRRSPTHSVFSWSTRPGIASGAQRPPSACADASSSGSASRTLTGAGPNQVVTRSDRRRGFPKPRRSKFR